MRRGLLRPALGLAFVALVMTLVVAALLMLRGSGQNAPGAPGSTLTPRPTAAASSPPSGSPSTSLAASAAPTSPTASPAASTAPPAVATLIGAGDIASCGLAGDSQTAALVEEIDGTVFTAGDNAYEAGTAREFRDCYDPTWGQFKDRTIPAPGNHDYGTSGAAGYLAYFGAKAHPNGTTWYSWEAGDWHVIMLDSDCGAVGGCEKESPQGKWLTADLAASHAQCTLAVWHHPRFSSGYHGNHDFMEPFWQILYDANADLVISGHDHDYERFAPQDPNGSANPERGIREIVVGTGGAGLRSFKKIRPNSEVRDAQTHGVIRLALGADGYSWNFIPVAGRTFSDSGSGTCH